MKKEERTNAKREQERMSERMRFAWMCVWLKALYESDREKGRERVRREHEKLKGERVRMLRERESERNLMSEKRGVGGFQV